MSQTLLQLNERFYVLRFVPETDDGPPVRLAGTVAQDLDVEEAFRQARSSIWEELKRCSNGEIRCTEFGYEVVHGGRALSRILVHPKPSTGFAMTLSDNE